MKPLVIDCETTITNRFKSKYYIDQKSGCWIWTAYKDKDGYGNMQIRGRPQQAHRISYSLFKGIVPEGKLVCHSCDNSSCVNPDHLWLGTQQENMIDKIRKGRMKGNWTNSDVPGRVLNEKNVLSIRKDTRTLKEIAKDFGTTSSNISAIKLYKSWKHVY